METGNIEYKLMLQPPSKDRFQQLVSQLQFRLAEGMGEVEKEAARKRKRGSECGEAGSRSKILRRVESLWRAILTK